MVSSRQVNISSYHRDAWVEVDLSALEHNVAHVKSWISEKPNSCRFMAVVKSDAYGHGAASISNVLLASGAEWLGVASVDEGCELRASGIIAPVLILSPSPFWALDKAISENLDLTVADRGQLKDIASIARRRKVKARIHIKVDTGMHRLGVAPGVTPDLVEEIGNNPNLSLKSVFSHLAKAGDADATNFQNQRFQQMLDSLKGDSQLFAHIASSEATRLFPETHHDMVRVGLYLYGLEPRCQSSMLLPALSVKARINYINRIAPGEPVGYNWTWTPERDTVLASIPIGYADGVDRRLSNKITALLHGKEINQVGLISMDQMLFDITDVKEAQEGDVVTLIGVDGEGERSLSGWAEELDTITYELACRLRARLPRIYTRHRREHSTLRLEGRANDAVRQRLARRQPSLKTGTP
ncbi:MAG: alanine racemase [Cyanobacteria bacterium]|nr:alanine racemase [Cyanobacteriota bacterium]